jgi:hypothetical protein
MLLTGAHLSNALIFGSHVTVKGVFVFRDLFLLDGGIMKAAKKNKIVLDIKKTPRAFI